MGIIHPVTTTVFYKFSNMNESIEAKYVKVATPLTIIKP